MLGKPWHYITNDDTFLSAFEEIRCATVLGCDVETTKKRDLPTDLVFDERIFKPGLDPYLSEIRLIQIATPERIFVIDCFKCTYIPLLRDIFASPYIVKIFHNAKFDVKMLMHQYGFTFRRIFCTMLASQVITNGKPMYKGHHKLADVALRYIGVTLDKTEQVSNWGAEELSKNQLDYASKDVDVLHDIYYAEMNSPEAFDPENQLNLIPTIRLECNACIAIARMELDGVFVDKRQWDSLHADVLAEFKDVEATLRRELGVKDINLDSPAQVKRALQAKEIDVNGTNEKKDLEPIAKLYPVVALLLEYRGIAKLLTSYLNGIPGKKKRKDGVYFAERIHPITGRVHADFSQCQTETGRMACERPNIQQVPADKRFRAAFTGQFRNDVKNTFIVSDYSQFEMRILCEVSKDPLLLKAFCSGLDIHCATAALMYNVPPETIMYKDPATHEKIQGPNYWMRQASKAINFGLVYGRGSRSIGAQLGLNDEESRKLISTYFDTYQLVQVWLYRTGKAGVRNKKVKTPNGRIRYFDFDPFNRKDCGSVERESKNMPIQGCNADITKIALYRVHCATEHLMGQVFMCNTIHDEINMECPPEMADEVCTLVKREMEEAAREILHDVPVIAEAMSGNDWSIK